MYNDSYFNEDFTEQFLTESSNEVIRYHKRVNYWFINIKQKFNNVPNPISWSLSKNALINIFRQIK